MNNNLERYRDKRIALLAGGPSAEAEISLRGARAIYQTLAPVAPLVQLLAKSSIEDFKLALGGDHYDLALVMVHGDGGEDGVLQSILEDFSIAYTGSNRIASALAWDKWQCKECWRSHNLATPNALLVNNNTDAEVLFKALGNQIVIKPCCGGSSLGVSKIVSPDEWPQAYADAFEVGTKVIAESYIEGEEYTVAFLGDQILPAVRVQTKDTMHDYAAKYNSDHTRYFCPSGLTARAELELSNLGRMAFKSLGCSGWGRIDVIRDDSGVFYLLEANTVPGMSSRSLLPKAAAAVDIDFLNLILSILDSAINTK